MSTELQDILAANLKALMGQRSGMKSQAAVGKKAGIDQRTVGRILGKHHNPTLPQIGKLAAAFGVMPWQLLVPHIDPTNPPVLAAATEAERKLYKKLRETVEEYEGKLRDEGNTEPGALP